VCVSLLFILPFLALLARGEVFCEHNLNTHIWEGVTYVRILHGANNVNRLHMQNTTYREETHDHPGASVTGLVGVPTDVGI
jgi:hypothetical protein